MGIYAEVASAAGGVLMDEAGRRLDPVWDSKAAHISLETYYEYFRMHGICTVLRAGKIAGYYKPKKEDRLQTAQK